MTAAKLEVAAGELRREMPEPTDAVPYPVPGRSKATLVLRKHLDGKLVGWIAEIGLAVHELGEIGSGLGSPPVVEHVRFIPSEPPELDAIPTQAALRSIHLGTFRKDLVELLETFPDRPTVRYWLDSIERGRRPGRRGAILRHYAEYCALRVEAEEHDPKRPVAWMAARRDETVGALNGILNKAAHTYGLLELEETPSGRKRIRRPAALTERCVQALEGRLGDGTH